jgi:uncharacterized protein (DUF488 family)
MPLLGTDQESRREYRRTGDFDRLAQMYSKRLDDNREHYEGLKNLTSKESVVMMCFEDDFSRCHRSIIAERLIEDGFEVVHLWSGEDDASW